MCSIPVSKRMSGLHVTGVECRNATLTLTRPVQTDALHTSPIVRSAFSMQTMVHSQRPSRGLQLALCSLLLLFVLYGVTQVCLGVKARPAL